MENNNTLYDKIQADIKDAMIAKDNVKRDCLRSLVSEIKNQTVNAGKPLTEDIVLSCIKKSVKMHNDSIEQFSKNNREDLAEKERNELAYLSVYLQKMHSESMVQTIILDIINTNKIPEVKQNMGKIMKLIAQRPDANLIDKKIASQYLNVLLK